MEKRLSITIITRNEEANLKRLLPVLCQQLDSPQSPVGEILILDSGSTDATQAVALSHGVRFLTHPFDGYGLQKRRVSAWASHPWILNLDADEVPEPDFWAGLCQHFSRLDAAPRAATISRDLVFLGKTLRFGGASGQKKIRLFDKRAWDWNTTALHEDVVPLDPTCAGPVGHVQGTVLHHSWPSTSAWIALMDKRVQQLAEGKAKNRRGVAGLAWTIPFRFAGEFLRSYVFRGGLLDGVPGLAYALFTAFAQSYKSIKVYEIVVSRHPPSGPA